MHEKTVLCIENGQRQKVPSPEGPVAEVLCFITKSRCTKRPFGASRIAGDRCGQRLPPSQGPVAAVTSPRPPASANLNAQNKHFAHREWAATKGTPARRACRRGLSFPKQISMHKKGILCIENVPRQKVPLSRPGIVLRQRKTMPRRARKSSPMPYFSMTKSRSLSPRPERVTTTELGRPSRATFKA